MIKICKVGQQGGSGVTFLMTLLCLPGDNGCRLYRQNKDAVKKVIMMRRKRRSRKKSVSYSRGYGFQWTVSLNLEKKLNLTISFNYIYYQYPIVKYIYQERVK